MRIGRVIMNKFLLKIVIAVVCFNPLASVSFAAEANTSVQDTEVKMLHAEHVLVRIEK